jgi:hypothetical protein
MEPAPGRRLVRPAFTLRMALLAVGVAALWGDTRWARSYVVFVAVTATIVAGAALLGPARRR